jgi:hypothetical protein
LAAGIRGRAAARDAATIHAAVATRVRDASAVHAVVSAVHDGASGFNVGALCVTAKTMLMLCDSIDSSSLFLFIHATSYFYHGIDGLRLDSAFSFFARVLNLPQYQIRRWENTHGMDC